MKKGITFAVKFIAFLTLLSICIVFLNNLFIPKYYYDETYSATNTYQDFYKLKKDSVDVLFFGSSHAACSFNPQIIYDKYGITSYNLASEQQSVLVTYYWLREALKYQSPKVVIIDTCTFHFYYDAYVYNGLNCSEGAVRKAMDGMKLSPLKAEAARDIEKIDPNQNAVSYLFPIIRYHSRWNNLTEKDYIKGEMVDHGAIKGYCIVGDKKPGAATVTFSQDDLDNVQEEPMVDIAETYLDKIIKCCDDAGIQLVFANIPCGESISRYKSTKTYADKKGIPFYDFNEEKLYAEIGYNVEEDAYSHPNYHGAEKISSYIGKLLVEKYNVASREDTSYETTRAVYEHKIRNILLEQTDNPYEYLRILQDPKYSIFIMGPKDYSKFIDDRFSNLLNEIGVKTDLSSKEVGVHYFFVRDSGQIVEKDTFDDFVLSGAIRNGLTIYNFQIDTTNMDERYWIFSMVIDGTECGNDWQGLNIVVYDNDLMKIVSKVNINTSDEILPMVRY